MFMLCHIQTEVGKLRWKATSVLLLERKHSNNRYKLLVRYHGKWEESYLFTDRMVRFVRKILTAMTRFPL